MRLIHWRLHPNCPRYMHHLSARTLVQEANKLNDDLTLEVAVKIMNSYLAQVLKVKV